MVKVVRKTTKGDITKAILSTIQVAGILSIALVAPNVISSLSKLGIVPSRYPNGIINRARNDLIKSGCLKMNSKGFLQLTEKGSHKLISYLCEDYVLNIPRVWDKKWRVISYDIKEEKRFLRGKLRKSLVSIGFVMLHGSVWVYPYDCAEFVALLKTDLKTGRGIVYMVVDYIETEIALKEHFKLS
jgi:DNA-binding transcriptional regulator PaaX